MKHGARPTLPASKAPLLLHLSPPPGLQLVEVQDTLRHPANPAHGGPDADVVVEARGPIRKMRQVLIAVLLLPL